MNMQITFLTVEIYCNISTFLCTFVFLHDDTLMRITINYYMFIFN